MVEYQAYLYSRSFHSDIMTGLKNAVSSGITIFVSLLNFTVEISTKSTFTIDTNLEAGFGGSAD